MANDLTVPPETVKTPLGTIEKTGLANVILKGDLSTLTADQKVVYYVKICERLDLDPFTRPFDYLVLNNKLVLYARKEAAEQLRIKNRISLTELEGSFTPDGNCYLVKVKARMGDREDVSTGAVSLLDKGGTKLTGEAYANCLLKAETKAKRRATLSICGLGMLDETEVETIPSARKVMATPQSQETWDRIVSVNAAKPGAVESHLKRLGVAAIKDLSEEQAQLIIQFVSDID